MSTATIDLEIGARTGSSAAEEASRLQSSEQLQLSHYDQIAAEYETHYSDASSLAYRRKFIYGPMFEGLTLSGMKVLDAMCGSGQTAEYLLSKNAQVTGLDISNEMVDSFNARWSNCKAIRRSLLDSGLPDESFDCVVVVGGLHHIQPNVSRGRRRDPSRAEAGRPLLFYGAAQRVISRSGSSFLVQTRSILLGQRGFD